MTGPVPHQWKSRGLQPARMGVTATVDGQCARGPKGQKGVVQCVFFAPQNKVHSLITITKRKNLEAFHFFVAIVASTWSLVMAYHPRCGISSRDCEIITGPSRRVWNSGTYPGHGFPPLGNPFPSHRAACCSSGIRPDCNPWSLAKSWPVQCQATKSGVHGRECRAERAPCRGGGGGGGGHGRRGASWAPVDGLGHCHGGPNIVCTCASPKQARQNRSDIAKSSLIVELVGLANLAVKNSRCTRKDNLQFLAGLRLLQSVQASRSRCLD